MLALRQQINFETRMIVSCSQRIGRNCRRIGSFSASDQSIRQIMYGLRRIDMPVPLRPDSISSMTWDETIPSRTVLSCDTRVIALRSCHALSSNSLGVTSCQGLNLAHSKHIALSFSTYATSPKQGPLTHRQMIGNGEGYHCDTHTHVFSSISLTFTAPAK